MAPSQISPLRLQANQRFESRGERGGKSVDNNNITLAFLNFLLGVAETVLHWRPCGV
jgi:hypothetical protein